MHPRLAEWCRALANRFAWCAFPRAFVATLSSTAYSTRQRSRSSACSMARAILRLSLLISERGALRKRRRPALEPKKHRAEEVLRPIRVCSKSILFRAGFGFFLGEPFRFVVVGPLGTRIPGRRIDERIGIAGLPRLEQRRTLMD